MARLDEALIEYLAEHDDGDRDDGRPPGELARSLRYPVTTYAVRERLRVLLQAGYVVPTSLDYDTYRIAQDGRLYLDGRIRADCLVPRPDPRRPGHVLG